MKLLWLFYTLLFLIVFQYIIKIIVLLSAILLFIKLLAFTSFGSVQDTLTMDNTEETTDNIPSIFINKDVLKLKLTNPLNIDEKSNRKKYVINEIEFEDDYNLTEKDNSYSFGNLISVNNIKSLCKNIISIDYSVNDFNFDDELSEWNYSAYNSRRQEFAEFELEEVDELTNDVKDDEYISKKDDLEELAVTDFQSTPSGIIINYEVFLTHLQWHTLMILDNDLVNCVVCDSYLDINAARDHSMSEQHLKNLNAHKPIERFELSITRRIKNLYHCGVCNITYPTTDEDSHYNSTHEANLLTAMNKANDIFDINNDSSNTDASYAAVTKRDKENESPNNEGFYDYSHVNNTSVYVPYAKVFLENKSASKNEYNTYFKNIGNETPETGISYAAVAKSPKSVCKEVSNSNYNVNVKNVDETTQDFTEYVNDLIDDLKYSKSDPAIGGNHEKYPTSVNANKYCENNNIPNLNNHNRIDDKIDYFTNKSNIVLRDNINTAESLEELSNIESERTKNVTQPTISNVTRETRNEIKIFSDETILGDKLNIPEVTNETNSERDKKENFKLPRYEFDNSKNKFNDINNKYLQETIRIVIKNTEFAVDLWSYNSIVYRGDNRYCFICSLGVYDGRAQDHIRSNGHTRNLSGHCFLDSYSQHLIRQKHPEYHCSICNVLIKHRHVAAHLQWPTHQRLSAQSKSKKLLKQTSKTHTLPTQEEKHLNTKARFKVHFDVHIVATPTIDDKVKKVEINGRILNVPYGNWHGIRHLKSGSKGFKCLTCQDNFNENAEEHCKIHFEQNMDKILDYYLPALIRKVNDDLVHCIICNKEITNSEEKIQTHLNAKSHNKNYDKLIKGSHIES